MNEEHIRKTCELLDGSGSDKEFQAMRELAKELGDRVASCLLQHYRLSKLWKPRASCLYHAIKYARRSPEAFILGVEAVEDKSQVVRYRACMLLAYAQKREALPALKRALRKFDRHKITRADVLAAIDAIESGNHHYFIDRSHSGKMTLSITEP